MVFICDVGQNHKLSDIINTTALCNFSVILGCAQQELNQLHRKEPRGFSREAVLAGSSRRRMGLQAGWQHAGRGRTKNVVTGIPPHSNKPSVKGSAEATESPDREKHVTSLRWVWTCSLWTQACDDKHEISSLVGPKLK